LPDSISVGWSADAAVDFDDPLGPFDPVDPLWFSAPSAASPSA
jgi:hypothetical protein